MRVKLRKKSNARNIELVDRHGVSIHDALGIVDWTERPAISSRGAVSQRLAMQFKVVRLDSDPDYPVTVRVENLLRAEDDMQPHRMHTAM